MRSVPPMMPPACCCICSRACRRQYTAHERCQVGRPVVPRHLPVRVPKQRSHAGRRHCCRTRRRTRCGTTFCGARRRGGRRRQAACLGDQPRRSGTVRCHQHARHGEPHVKSLADRVVGTANVNHRVRQQVAGHRTRTLTAVGRAGGNHRSQFHRPPARHHPPSHTTTATAGRWSGGTWCRRRQVQ